MGDPAPCSVPPSWGENKPYSHLQRWALSISLLSLQAQAARPRFRVSTARALCSASVVPTGCVAYERAQDDRRPGHCIATTRLPVPPQPRYERAGARSHPATRDEGPVPRADRAWRPEDREWGRRRGYLPRSRASTPRSAGFRGDCGEPLVSRQGFLGICAQG